jgi:hypothetical protein
VLWLCGVVSGGVWNGLLARPGARGCRGAESYFPYHCDVSGRLCVPLCVCVWCCVGVSGWWGGEAACCAWASASRSSVRRLVSDVLCGPCVHVVLCCLFPVLVQCSVLVKKNENH